MKILFLCTGNSCRSQMAEGWVRHLSKGLVRATSAGIEQHGQNPRAIAAMQAAGVDISTQESTILSDKMLEYVDLVVTVCGHAEEHCPVLPKGIQTDHWPLEDPAKVTGTEEEIVRAFENSRDEIRARVEKLLST